MSQKTESVSPDPAPELSNQYLGSLVVASVLVLALVILGGRINPLAAMHIEGGGSMQLLYPWVLAGGQTIANGLEEFSGTTLQPVTDSIYYASFCGILFSGLVVPTLTLLLMGIKKPAVARGVYLASSIVAVTLCITVLPTGFIAYQVKQSLRSAQAVQTNRDHIINELNKIAWKTREYRILPKALGGGGGALAGYTLPSFLTETDEATYVLRLIPELPNAQAARFVATIRASSKKFTDCSVEVSVEPNGKLWNWTYTGQFQ
jgi:hypothetical protein